ncbi:MAG TPA: hypothetical protein VKN76_10545 [Kiloniellaceae bacterium]|nr:hypothetical protein [Kiloniellaceae bacterium]
MLTYLTWQIVLRKAQAVAHRDVPDAVLTVGPGFRHENMPDEVAFLLPTNDGPKALIDRMLAARRPRRDRILGLFLADPFLNLTHACRRLRDAGQTWVTNLPSVVQQDEDFARQLPDVGLDSAREFGALARFRDEGFKVAAVVSDQATAETALGIAPEALIVMPRVGDFAAGFPSLRQRGSAAQAVAAALREAGGTTVMLGLGQAEEVGHENQWPPPLDGLLCRPLPFRFEEASDGL